MEIPKFAYEPKEVVNTSKLVDRFAHQKTKIDWGKMLISDMNQVINILL